MSITNPGEVGSALVVSASLDPESRSERIARRYCEALVTRGVASRFLTLKDYAVPGFDNPSEPPPDCDILHRMVLDAEAIVLAGPIYNWGCSAELKRFVEFVGTTPPDGTRRGAFFDKIVTFVASAGCRTATWVHADHGVDDPGLQVHHQSVSRIRARPALECGPDQ